VPTHLEFRLIESAVLVELAEKAMQEAKAMQNPYLKALMERLRRLALELKAALESEGRLDGSRSHPADNDQSHE
jgi:hypothetical protein